MKKINDARLQNMNRRAQTQKARRAALAPYRKIALLFRTSDEFHAAAIVFRTQGVGGVLNSDSATVFVDRVLPNATAASIAMFFRRLEKVS